MNYGKRLKLTFDRTVYHVTNAELTKWVLKNVYSEMVYPTGISYGDTQNIVNLDFADFNNIVEPATLECLGCVKMGSPDLPLDPYSMAFYPKNLWPIPSDYEYLALSNIEVEGEIAIGFDGKLYADEYLQLGSITVEAENIIVTFNQRHGAEYLQLGSIAVEGQYCDINGVPL